MLAGADSNLEEEQRLVGMLMNNWKVSSGG